MTIRVAIDSGPLETGHKVRGVGSYTSELLKSLKEIKDESITIEAVDFGKTDLSKYDLLHYTYFHPYFPTLPKRRYKNGQKVVVTIHDLIQLIFPRQYEAGVRGTINFWKQKRALKNVDAVIVPSNTSKKDVIRFLPIDGDKIHVIYEGVKKVYLKEISSGKLNEVKDKYKLPSKFVLYVGDINYNKNIPNLIDACKIAKIPLVISGKQAKEIEMTGLLGLVEMSGPRDWYRFLFDIPHPEVAHYSEIIERYNSVKNILRLGFAPDEDLAGIYRLSSVYCQPSIYEGFGLPVLEAMASGTPVVVSKTNALTEIADNAALVSDPYNPKDIAEKITLLHKDGVIRKQILEKSKIRVKEFSWEKTGKETIEIYKKVTAIS